MANIELNFQLCLQYILQTSVNRNLDEDYQECFVYKAKQAANPARIRSVLAGANWFVSDKVLQQDGTTCKAPKEYCHAVL